MREHRVCRAAGRPCQPTGCGAGVGNRTVQASAKAHLMPLPEQPSEGGGQWEGMWGEGFSILPGLRDNDSSCRRAEQGTEPTARCWRSPNFVFSFASDTVLAVRERSPLQPTTLTASWASRTMQKSEVRPRSVLPGGSGLGQGYWTCPSESQQWHFRWPRWPSRTLGLTSRCQRPGGRGCCSLVCLKSLRGSCGSGC